MNNLAWQPSRSSSSDEMVPREVRGLLILAVVAGLHCLPAMFLTLPTPKPLGGDDDAPVAFEFVDTPPGDPLAAKPADAPVETNKLEPDAAPKIAQASPDAVKSPDAALLKPPEIAPPAVAAVIPPPQNKPAPEAQPQAETPKAKAPLPSAIPIPEKAGVAFDESKAKGEAPKDAYLSDRTSSAADRGPKNLPRGDPFMDKGRSKEILYNEIRGEGNLPPLASDANSGSVKKEGSADAGKGPQDDKRFADEKAPVAPLALKDKVNQPGLGSLEEKTEKAAGVKDTPAKRLSFPELDKLDKVAAVSLPKPVDNTANNDLFGAPSDKTESKAPEKIEPLLPIDAKPAQVLPRPDDPAEIAQQKGNAAEPAALAPKKIDPNRELADFAALLDGTGKTNGRGGNAGEKAGINAREGQKGNEGNGTMRPGNADAVSDVTTLNLDTSAEETDDARFGKKFDPLSTYFKKVARRIDNKWKAEIVARGRIRITRGVVYIRLVVRRDGKLIEATEVKRDPLAMPDEYAAIAKAAVQRATDPLSDPFPPDLAQHETLDRVFEFIYY